MPGFLGVLNELKSAESLFTSCKRPDLVVGQITFEHIFIERRTISKFLNDKLFFQNDEIIIVVEGVILNSKELIHKYGKGSFKETVLEMQKKNKTFFSEFRGSFSGLTFNKTDHELLLFTDHIGSKQVFYSTFDQNFIFGSEINYITDFAQKGHATYSLSNDSAYFLLTFGFMLEDHTLFNEIKKLKPGCYLTHKQGTTKVERYYKLNNLPTCNLSENEIIDRVDLLFRKAVKAAFDKDKEYGYKHLVALSAGLDSRMTTWVAHDLGYSDNLLSYTFSQTGAWDEITSKRIACDLKHEWLFKSLDSGQCLKKIEDVVKITSGGAIYSAQAHTQSWLDVTNLSSFGIFHSGQLGDVILNTFYSSLNPNKAFTVKSGAYSCFLKEKVNFSILQDEYENEEIFKFYTRGFTGANQGLLTLQEYSETFSPFYDIEFMDFCLSIPLKLRFGHYIYDKWVTTKYPEAAKYRHNAGRKIGGVFVIIGDARVNIMNIPRRGLKFLKSKLQSPLASRTNMNPFDYWYRTNPELKSHLDNYFQEHIEKLTEYPELKNDCINMYNKCGMIEKTQVLTLLAAMTLYFPNNKNQTFN